MKRFFSLLALAVAPVLGHAADMQQQQQADGKSAMGCMGCMCNWLTGGPVSAVDETWAARTQLDWGKHHNSHEGLHLNTIQPIYRADDFRNTVFVQGGVGNTLRGHEHGSSDIGLGYRYLTVDSSNMFGLNMFYNSPHFYNLSREDHGYRANFEWFTQYTTVTLGRHTDRKAKDIGKWSMWKRLGDFNRADTTLDLAFQLPYLPWAQMLIGKNWEHHHNGGLRKLDYSFNFNLLSCLSLQAGYHNGWNKSPFARLILTFGRAASMEHTLTDKLIGDEAFTARDLRNYTLQTADRTEVR